MGDVCEHGSLRRQCRECELLDEIERLQGRLAALADKAWALVRHDSADDVRAGVGACVELIELQDLLATLEDWRPSDE